MERNLLPFSTLEVISPTHSGMVDTSSSVLKGKRLRSISPKLAQAPVCEEAVILEFGQIEIAYALPKISPNSKLSLTDLSKSLWRQRPAVSLQSHQLQL